MTRYRVLFGTVLRKELRILRRYLFNTVMLVVGMYLLFALLFFGGGSLAPEAVAESLPGIVVGFFLWMTAVTAFQSTASNVTQEAQWGTLEQLYMSPYGIGRVVATSSAVHVLTSFLLGLVVLGLMLLTTRTTLAVDVVTLVTIGLLTLLPVAGMGFAFGGIALLYKRVGQANSLVQFGLVGFIALPVDANPLVRFLPMSLGSHMLQAAMAEGTRLWEFPLDSLVVLVATGVVYVAAGFLALRWLHTLARRRGVMGHY